MPLQQYLEALLDPNKAKAMADQLRRAADAGTTLVQTAGGRSGGAVVKTYDDAASAGKELADAADREATARGKTNDAMRIYNGIVSDGVELAKALGGNTEKIAANLSLYRSQLGAAFAPTVTGGLRK